MNILAISGSVRAASTNTAMLRAVAALAAPEHEVTVLAGLGDLPVFSPDLETGAGPSGIETMDDRESITEKGVVTNATLSS